MRILGVNFGHSAAACLVEDGRILSAVEEEKLSRVKGDTTFPQRAVQFILKKHRLRPEDIDVVAIGCRDLTEFGYGYRQLSRYLRRTILIDKCAGLFYDGIKRLFPYQVNLSGPLERLFYDSLNEMGFPKEKVRLVDHHTAHAASAYYTSPWRDAAIVTNDGKGDGLCGAFFIGNNETINCVDKIADRESIGQFYQSVTQYLGYKPNRHEGKITGLAALGDYRETFPLMRDIYRYEDGKLHNTFYEIGSFRKDPLGYFKNHCDLEASKAVPYMKYIKSLHGPLMNFAVVYQMYINYLKDKMGSFAPKEMAAGIQKLAEEAMVSYVQSNLNSHANVNICLAGGVFANVKINQRIREIPGVGNVYIHPAMDDAGTSLGAALSVWMNETGQKQWGALKTVYLGPDYTEEEMEQSLKKYGLSYRRSKNPEEEIGWLIYEGKIVGRFNGALEWGPRALGNRSILARPIEKNINDTLNKRLKRTEFMPFAPSMLDTDAEDFLMGYRADQIAAKYMTITYNVHPELISKIQAAVHVDGTARPQVVFKEDNPSFYAIIQAYKKLSGFGVVINTSFNMHEEPIVATPEDAIRAFLVNAVDVLSLGPFIVESQNP